MPRPTASLTFGVDAERVLDVIEHAERLPEVLDGLERATPLGHRRWRWSVRYCGRGRDVDVVTTVDRKAGRVAWKALHKPTFDGEFRVTPLGETMCRVTLQLDIQPSGFVESFAEMTGLTGWMVERDLQRLADILGTKATAAA